MIDRDHFKHLITERLNALGVRMHEIDSELGHRLTADLEDQAIDLEDDEVLEGLGAAARKEIDLLKQAIRRIEDGSYGICLKCGDPISRERLEAVLYTPLCRTCANSGT